MIKGPATKKWGKSNDRTEGKRRGRHARREKSDGEARDDTLEVPPLEYRERGYTFCGPIHQIGCGMFRVISQPF